MQKKVIDGIRDYYKLPSKITDEQIAKTCKGSLGEICVNIDIAKKDLSNFFKKSETEKWKPINTAPKKKLVLIKGPSGRMIHPVYCMSAYFDDEWQTVQNDSVRDSYPEPTHWMEIP